MGREQTDTQTHRQTDGRVDSLTNSAQRAELVKNSLLKTYKLSVSLDL